MKQLTKMFLVCSLYITLIFSIDIISTILALEFTNAYESNSLVAYILTTYSLLGYFISIPIIILIVLILSCSFVTIFSLIHYSIYKKFPNQNQITTIFIAGTAIYLLTDIFAILNNLIIFILG